MIWRYKIISNKEIKIFLIPTIFGGLSELFRLKSSLINKLGNIAKIQFSVDSLSLDN